MVEEDGTSVLLLADRSDGSAAADECDDLLRADREPTAELRVSFSTTETGTHVSETADRRPSRTGLISVGDEGRSTTADGGPDSSEPIAVDAVADPGNLREIGLSVSRFCERWDDATILVCFDSLGELLEHATDDAAFRFTTLLNERLQSVGAVAHFHLDASNHDDSVVNTFASIFDEVLQPDEAVDSDETSDDGGDEKFEASDEQIRRLAEEFDDDDDRFTVVEKGDRTASAGGDGEITEASDEEIAEIFE